MTSLYVALAGLTAAYLITRRRPQTPATTELTVFAVEGVDVLIGYSHPTGTGLVWLTKETILAMFLALHGARNSVQLVGTNIDGQTISLPVDYDTWAQIVEAV